MPIRFAKLMLSDEVATHDGRPVVYELVRNPPVDDASAVSAVPPDPKRSDPSTTAASPVPPPATFKVPEVDGVSVKVPDELVIELPKISPLNDCVEVPKVMAPVCAVPYVCWSDDTPLLILDVATHVGVPPLIASTKPAVPLVIADTLPVVPRRRPESDAIRNWLETY